jgi:hypothetical protein
LILRDCSIYHTDGFLLLFRCFTEIKNRLCIDDKFLGKMPFFLKKKLYSHQHLINISDNWGARNEHVVWINRHRLEPEHAHLSQGEVHTLLPKPMLPTPLRILFEDSDSVGLG